MVISHCSSLLHKLFTSKTLIGSFTKPSPFKKTLPVAPSSHPHLFHSLRLVLSTSPEKPISRFQMLALKNNGSVRNTVRNNNGSPKNISNGFSSVSHANIPRPDSQVRLEIHEVNGLALVPIKLRQKILIEKEKKPRQKMEEVGIDSNLSRPGQYNHLICPMEFSFVDLFSSKTWWRGGTSAFADEKSTYGKMSQFPKVKHIRKITYKTEKYIGKITEESLELERPCGELLSYFAARMISRETLQRNSVMQRRCNDQIVIAFPYRRNGVLVSCKYRDINKNFWQEKDTEKIFYGLDDIKDESNVIIVEGEIDKLSLEEAGFQNCVSVPDGAPPLVFREELPSEEQDTEYQYLWNCKEYLEKASRIILATDGDPPGQALAEELACRLGKERCWRVRWPKKNKVGYFKDANEVLMYVGPGLLKEVIENAELYPIQGLFSFRDYFDEIDAYYHGTLGYEFGAPTGWRSLDQLYNEKGHEYYDGTTKEQLKKKQKFVKSNSTPMDVGTKAQGKQALVAYLGMLRVNGYSVTMAKWLQVQVWRRRFGVSTGVLQLCLRKA